MIKDITVFDRLKQLDEERAKIIESAKQEVLDTANMAIQQLNEMGFSYRLVSTSRRHSVDGDRKGTRQVDPNKPCPVCKFVTVPFHDGRRHRGQEPQHPFTEKELEGMGMRKA